MSWLDDSPPQGHLRYRIRRECLDTRYQWLSEEVHWPAKPEKRLWVRPPTRPLNTEVALEVESAARGTLEVQLYDVQGRIVLRRESQALGEGLDLVRLALGEARGPLVNGIYFVRVGDSAGQEATVRLVVLR
jgi:hypothetical protein